MLLSDDTDGRHIMAPIFDCRCSQDTGNPLEGNGLRVTQIAVDSKARGEQPGRDGVLLNEVPLSFVPSADTRSFSSWFQTPARLQPSSESSRPH